MEDTITLGVLDQVPVRNNDTASLALKECVELAVCCEKWGYHRFWVAEHHHSYAFASTSPDVLICQIAAQTNKMRIGSGGVMILNHSALQVAERFKILEAFYEGRIDLGIGKARGTDEFGSKAISYPNLPQKPDIFEEQVSHLLEYLDSKLQPTHPFSLYIMQPGLPTRSQLQVWMLGLSITSATFAGKMGLKYSIAHFLNNDLEQAYNSAKAYRDTFIPNKNSQKPEITIAVEVMCAQTEEEAKYLAATRNLYNAINKLDLPGYNGLYSPEDSLIHLKNPNIALQAQISADRCIDGNPTQVKNKIIELAKKYSAGQVLILTNCYSFSARKRSYELLAKEFQLSSN